MLRIIPIILLCTSLSSFAQNISLDDIVKIRTKDLATVEEFLTNKGWSFLSGDDRKPGYMGSASFSYNKSRYDDKAESFLNYYYSEDSEYNRISVQISLQHKYNEFLARIKAYGCKLLTSNIVDGNVEKVYQGKTTTFVVRVSTQKDDYSSTSSVYSVFIMNNFDYHVEAGE